MGWIMQDKRIAMGIVAVGVVVGLVSILADTISIGTDDSFGTLQVLGTVAGIVLVIGGIAFMNYGDRFMAMRGGNKKEGDQ